GHGLPGAGWRWHLVLSPARAPGGSRTHRDPHLQLEGRLPPLPGGAQRLDGSLPVTTTLPEQRGADGESLARNGRPLRYSNFRREVWLPAVKVARVEN